MVAVNIIKVAAEADVPSLMEAVEDILAPWGGMGAFVKPGDKVLLKPNVGVVAPGDSAVITAPAFTEAVACLAREAGAAQVWIGESCVVGVGTELAFQAAGYDKLPAKTGALLIDLKQEPYAKVSLENPLQFPELAVCRRALDADIIINLPKLKTIIATPISVAMKNLKGLIPDFEKIRCHHTNLNRAIVDVNQAIRPALTIVDGTIGSSLYEPMAHHILLAGDNVVAVDTIAALCMGVDPQTVTYLVLGAEQGLGPMELENISLYGEKPAAVALNYAVAKEDLDGYAQLYPGIHIAAGQACSGCVNMIELLLKNAIKLGAYEKWQDKLVLAIGPTAPLEHPGKVVLCLGNCLGKRQSGPYIPGCTFMAAEGARWLADHEPLEFF